VDIVDRVSNVGNLNDGPAWPPFCTALAHRPHRPDRAGRRAIQLPDRGPRNAGFDSINVDPSVIPKPAEFARLRYEDSGQRSAGPVAQRRTSQRGLEANSTADQGVTDLPIGFCRSGCGAMLASAP
jgi:hypothetical protein